MAKLKTNSSFYVKVGGLSLVGVSALLADAKLNASVGSLADSKLNISAGALALSKLSSILFSTITVIVGIWVTCYLLFFQLYKDRYPIKVLKEKYLPQMRDYFLLVVYSVLFGCIVLVQNPGIVSNSWFCFISLATTITIMVNIYQTNKTLMVNSYIDDYCKKLEIDLENCNNTICNQTFKDIRYIIDDCIVREEYYVAQNFVKRIGEVFRAFLDNSIKLLSNGQASQNCIQDSFRKLVLINIQLLESCSNINSKLIISNIVRQQENNIQYCISTNQYEWFKDYLDECNRLLFRMQKDSQLDIVDEILNSYSYIFRSLIEQSKLEWVDYAINQLIKKKKSL